MSSLKRSKPSTDRTPSPPVKRQKGSASSGGTVFYAQLLQFLEHLRFADDQRYFWLPVNKKLVPYYYKVINKPMDFSTIEKNIGSKTYKTLLDFSSDMELVFSNAREFNEPASDIAIAAVRIQKVFHALLKDMQLNKQAEDVSILYDEEQQQPPVPASSETPGANVVGKEKKKEVVAQSVSPISTPSSAPSKKDKTAEATSGSFKKIKVEEKDEDPSARKKDKGKDKKDDRPQIAAELSRILEFLRNDDDAAVFYPPVTEDVAPNYFSVVKQPICIQDMEKKVLNDSYVPAEGPMEHLTVLETAKYGLLKDIALMFQNARMYNEPKSWIVELACGLERKLLKFLGEKDSFVGSLWKKHVSKPADVPPQQPLATSVTISGTAVGSQAAADVKTPAPGGKDIAAVVKDEPKPRGPTVRSLLMDTWNFLSHWDDRDRIFAAPVSTDMAPDYYSVIKHPMDLATLRSLITRGTYTNQPSGFLRDVELIFTNCIQYNDPRTLYCRKAKEGLDMWLYQLKPKLEADLAQTLKDKADRKKFKEDKKELEDGVADDSLRKEDKTASIASKERDREREKQKDREKKEKREREKQERLEAARHDKEDGETEGDSSFVDVDDEETSRDASLEEFGMLPINKPPLMHMLTADVSDEPPLHPKIYRKRGRKTKEEKAIEEGAPENAFFIPLAKFQLFQKRKERLYKRPMRLVDVLQAVMDKWMAEDVHNLFKDPIDEETCPDYFHVVEREVCLLEMQEWLSNGKYDRDFEAFVVDFGDMCKNAMAYNKEGTLFHGEARRLLESSRPLFDAIRQRLVRILPPARPIGEKNRQWAFMNPIAGAVTSIYDSGVGAPRTEDALPPPELRISRINSRVDKYAEAEELIKRFGLKQSEQEISKVAHAVPTMHSHDVMIATLANSKFLSVVDHLSLLKAASTLLASLQRMETLGMPDASLLKDLWASSSVVPLLPRSNLSNASFAMIEYIVLRRILTELVSRERPRDVVPRVPVDVETAKYGGFAHGTKPLLPETAIVFDKVIAPQRPVNTTSSFRNPLNGDDSDADMLEIE
ncbi:mitochondrial Bromodomain domain-containing protein [Andalucia godoyi]|uniref:Mitochondrial Bromodomain domain-containing protein n=1 Tax=Andalucia godoyi TaxID=505711 RepID=A0A8K0AIK2_ANDGO|nr:mitochondrial Bromodomain domain-containing protein [Andalucia godoyi]|eukprot:ANDGO_08501.mRNA.1 mitochondrial Bromodomain domain-containing protein